MSTHPLAGLHTAFAELDDPRVDRTKEHQLLDVGAIAICAVMCGADSWVAVAEFGTTTHTWLQRFRAVPNGIPSHATFGRVFAALDATQVQQGFLRWVRAVWSPNAGAFVAVAGTTLCGSHDRGIGKDALHVVRAWLYGERGCDGLPNRHCHVDRAPRRR